MNLRKAATAAAVSGTETLTIRLPKTLKATLDEAARTRAMTVTALVRQTLEQSLMPVSRTYQHPGLAPEFGAFLELAGRKQRPIIVLVLDDKSGQRFFFQGSIEPGFTNPSMLAIKQRGGLPWIIPRRDVVAWFAGDSADLDELAVSLTHQGWAARSGR